MTDKLPGNLLQLFAPRPALRYLPNGDFEPAGRKTREISGVAAFLPQAEEHAKIPYNPTESWLEAHDRKMLEKKENHEYMHNEGFATQFKPSEDTKIRGDAFRTLFVSRLDYKTDTQDIQREFGRFGPIERIRIVTNTGESNPKKKGKPLGYAFVVYENEKDMKGKHIASNPRCKLDRGKLLLTLISSTWCRSLQTHRQPEDQRPLRARRC